MTRVRQPLVPGYAFALAMLVLAPLLPPGYLLLRDAVSTPRSYLTDAALGLTDAAPRAVPQDAAIAWISTLIDGGVAVKALLLAGLWLAGWGGARLAAAVLPGTGLPGQFVAVTVAIWNPYVAERLLQGHWSLLVGYGCLPWAAAAVLRLRSDGTGWRAMVFWIALAGLTPTGLMLAAIVALTAVAVPGGGHSRPVCAAAVLGSSVLAATPWLAASAMTGSLSAYEAAGSPGITAFAARAEPMLGTLMTLAGLGGIWNGEAVPASRTTSLALIGTAVLLTVLALGLPTVLRAPAARPLLVLSVAAVAVPALLATGPGLAALRVLVEAAPGLGVLRDSQKWVAAAVPGYTLAAAAAVHAVRTARPAVVAALACAAVIAVLPDLTWGVGGQLKAVHYPPGWAAVAAQINADPATVAVLPTDSMRQYRWAGPAPVLDPLPRWVRSEVLTTGDLVISGNPVRGEGNRARQVQDLLLAGAGPDALTRAGVGWLVVEHSPGDMGAAAGTLAELPVAYRDTDLELYRIGGDSPAAGPAKRRVAIVSHLAWLAMLVIGATGWLPRRRVLTPGR
jgi:hypothetical protein